MLAPRTTSDAIKFPKTPRVADVVAGNVHRTWRSLDTVVEEKVDGANVGIFFDSGALCLQSRGHVLRGGEGEAQFAPLHAWAAERLTRLRDALGDQRVLYGEWCFAKHRAFYDALPDWLLAFDVLDRPRNSFLTTAERDAVFASVDARGAPRLWRGRFSRAPPMAALLGPSRLKTARWRSALDEEARRAGARSVTAGTDPSDWMEGLYVRVEDTTGVVARMKLHVLPTEASSVHGSSSLHPTPDREASAEVEVDDARGSPGISRRRRSAVCQTRGEPEPSVGGLAGDPEGLGARA